ncbi:dipeptide/oligopeptide/nickel ABC transporter permease/ATP-binding protein [Catenulispora subtropica]|uniref:Dipeptide/oligopeptide/nickel ABC transporter permease/ATP-binding protein n=1 Tax=Catenulispora subtropica TaxID=450798 RepID=A0ABN2QD36_9ACTN
MSAAGTAPGGARRVAGSFVRKPLSTAALAYIVVVALCSVFAGILAPYAPDAEDLPAALTGPSWAHPLGAGALGRDVLSRLMYGGRVSLLSVLISLGVYLAVGVPAGMIAGYRGGRIDRLVLRVSEIGYCVPAAILVLVVVTVMPADESAAMVVLGLSGASALARVVRSATVGVRGELYVRAAVANGIGDAVILRRHILPRVIGTVIVQASLFGAAAVGLEVGLGFLGLGATGVSWGTLIGEASKNIGNQPWLLVPSGVLVALYTLSLGLIGDGVRDSIAELATGPVPRNRRQGERADASDRPDAEAPPKATQPDTEAARSSRITGALLTVEGLHVAFPIDGVETEVVTDVAFAVRRGEALGIVGESGCGKSVAAAAIVGLLRGGGRVTAGRVLFDGDVVFDAADDRAGRSRKPDHKQRALRGGRIGLIAQDPISGLDPSFTIGSQIADVVRAHRDVGRRAARERALELIAMVQLPDPARIYRSYPHQLSGGMAQRAGIAAALAGDPDLIIADEPTTALDVTVQAEILDLLRGLRDSGTAVLLITHDWGVLADFCDRAVVMYAGQVVETASVRGLLGRPQHPYTAGLLASNPHNAVPGEPLPAIEGAVPAPGDWPRGCRFADRCALVTDECRTRPVPLRTSKAAVPGDGAPYLTRCVHADQVAAPLTSPLPTIEGRPRVDAV